METRNPSPRDEGDEFDESPRHGSENRASGVSQ